MNHSWVARRAVVFPFLSESQIESLSVQDAKRCLVSSCPLIRDVV